MVLKSKFRLMVSISDFKENKSLFHQFFNITAGLWSAATILRPHHRGAGRGRVPELRGRVHGRDRPAADTRDGGVAADDHGRDHVRVLCMFWEPADRGERSWKTPFVMQTAVCTMLATGAPWIPHSPRWLLVRGRRSEAERVLVALRTGEEEREELLLLPCADSEEEEKSGWCRVKEQYTAAWGKEVRGKAALAVYMLGTQQLSGIDGVLYYAPMLFTQAGLSSQKASFLASGVTGIVNVVLTAFAQIFTDRWYVYFSSPFSRSHTRSSRHPALIIGGILMALPMTTIRALYAHPSATTKPGQYAVISMIFMCFAAFIMSWAILMCIHVSEAQPVRTRASVSSLAQSSNWVVNWAVAFSTPMFLQKTPSRPYFLWAASIWVAVAAFVMYLPETWEIAEVGFWRGGEGGCSGRGGGGVGGGEKGRVVDMWYSN